MRVFLTCVILTFSVGCFGMNKKTESQSSTLSQQELARSGSVIEKREEVRPQNITVSGNVAGSVTITPEKPSVTRSEVKEEASVAIEEKSRSSEQKRSEQFNPFSYILYGVGFLLILLSVWLLVKWVSSSKAFAVVEAGFDGGARALNSMIATVGEKRKSNLDPLRDLVLREVEDDVRNKLNRLHEKRS